MGVSAEQPDWEREKLTGFWNPGRQLIRCIRKYQKYQREKKIHSALQLRLTRIQFHFWSVITGADIPLTIDVSGGLLMPHPNGIVIHPQACIGPNCLIHQQVTLGVKSDQGGAPRVGGHVDIGAGAKLIGPISIGKHVIIGANAVVTKDVPDYAIVAGVPAQVIGFTPSTS